MSLVVAITALPARLFAPSFSDVAAHRSIAANLLVGSLFGAWLGASWATRMHLRWRADDYLTKPFSFIVLVAGCARSCGSDCSNT